MSPKIDLSNIKVGFAMCGSYCTFEDTFESLLHLKETGCDITPIMSGNAYYIDTRFGTCEQHIRRFEDICQKPVMHSIVDVEPVGPKKLLDVLVIAPCTGNTLAKLALGITDTSVTMAAKAHLRNKRPVVIAVSTNDGLSASLKNIGLLMNTKNVYFVPFLQDDKTEKENSLLSNLLLIPDTIKASLAGRQLQPVLMVK